MIVYKPISKIAAISFDLDDTFYANWPYIIEAEQHLRAYIKASFPEAAHFNNEQWHQFKAQALIEEPSLKNDMGVLRKRTLYAAFVAAGMPNSEIDEAVQRCFDFFYDKRSDFTVDENVHQVLNQLSQKVPLVAITNGNVDCEKIGIARYFAHVLHANQKQRMKPYPDMFKRASHLLSLPLDQILHVGDNLEKDVWGASRCGMMSAWYAFDRPMNILGEKALTLPHIQLEELSEIPKLL